jgi:hypothetical protein
MEEVAGDAATLVDPGDVSGLADVLDVHLAGPAGPDHVLADRRRRGFDIVARHTWTASADRHMEAYRWAAGRGLPRGDDGRPPSQ